MIRKYLATIYNFTVPELVAVCVFNFVVGYVTGAITGIWS